MCTENEVREKVGDSEDRPAAATRWNPRLVFTSPDDYFDKEFYHDLLAEQQEQS